MAEDHLARDSQFVAEQDAAGGTGAVAAVYAEALLGAAQNAGALDAVLEEYKSLIVDVLDKFPQLAQVLESAFVDADEKTAMLDRIFGGKMSKTMLHFLKVAARHGRLDLLRPIYREVQRLVQEKLGRVPIVVTTAAPIDAALLNRIGEGLRSIVPGQPVIEQRVDPSLVGGMVVRVGDTVYDASLATQMKNVRQQMIDRSTHEIQSRRDRFRNPAGN